MDSIKDILCPDCEEEYITQERYDKYGICIACARRKTIADRSNIEYIKFKDLSEREKSDIRHRRLLNQKSYKYRKSGEDKARRVEQEKIAEEKCNNTDPIPEVRITSRSIYTEDMMEYLIEIADRGQYTSTELFDKLKAKYPDKPVTKGNFGNIISRHNIPHIIRRGRGSTTSLDVKNNNTHTDSITDIVSNIESLEQTKQDIIANINTELNSVSNKLMYESIKPTVEIPEDEYNKRFKPLEDEIDSVLQDKGEQLKCNVERTYNTDDYINMLDMLLYLAKNSESIINNRSTMHQLTNGYQSDMIHVLENEVAKPGDTSFSDKLHVLRNKRRLLEYDYNDMITLKRLLDTFNTELIENTISCLKTLRNNRNNFIFVPLVDDTMTDKYSWATKGDYKQVTPQLPQYRSNRRDVIVSNPRLLKFRATCKLSGAGYGAFAPWHTDYSVTCREVAMDKAVKELRKLINSKPGLMYTDLEVHQINL